MPSRKPPAASGPHRPRGATHAGIGRLLCLATLLTLASPAPASTVRPARESAATPTPADGPVPSSFVELRDRGVIRQRRDYSCGAAALATLFVHQWGEAVDEEDILTTLSRIMPAEELARRREDGLTLLDLSRVARARGYRAQGFRLGTEQLGKLRGPVIVYIDPDGYEHFSVLEGIVGDRAHLADPSLGNVSYPLHRFLDMWLREDGAGIAFAVAPLRSEVDTQPVGALAPPLERSIGTAFEGVRPHLPFSTFEFPTRNPTR